MGTERQREFKRNVDLESLLSEINGLLAPVEKSLCSQFTMPKFPVLFVVGAPRSGTTLTMQWLAGTGAFAYPTNILSRFYGAPAVGARIQLLLADPKYSFRDEILDFAGGIDFQSSLGKTKGALSPNEFWYFWRRFIPNIDPEHLDETALAEVKSAEFASELAAVEAVFQKPFATKGIILQFNILFLSSILDKVLFLHLKRHPFYNIQSLIESREKYYGSRSAWYSVKPKEYEFLKDLDCPFEQVAGQIYYTNQAIEEGLSEISPERYLTVPYESFCRRPRETFAEIIEKIGRQGCPMAAEYSGVERFQDTNEVRLSAQDTDKAVAAYRKFSGETIEP